MYVSCRSPGADYDIVGGDHLGCQFNSILQTTGLQYRDFIYVSFHNQVCISLVVAVYCLKAILNSVSEPNFMLQIYEIPFFVALDHKREAVVVAVRGTLSLKVPYLLTSLLFSFLKFLNTFSNLPHILQHVIFQHFICCVFAIFKISFCVFLIITLCFNSVSQLLDFFFPLINLIVGNLKMAKLVSKYKQKSVFGIEVRQDLICSCWSVLQDVLTDLSAECENLPIEGVLGACYAHKVHSNTQYITLTPAWITNF